MSDNRFSKRRSGKVQRFRPAGGLKRQPKNLKIKGDGREEMVGSRMMDEPVYESSRHEKDISTSENKAFGISKGEQFFFAARIFAHVWHTETRPLDD